MEEMDYTKMKRVTNAFENLEKWSYAPERYNAIVSQLKKNPHPFCEQVIGSRRKIYKFGKFICTEKLSVEINLGGIKKSQFPPFLGLFNKTLYQQFMNNPSLYDQKIEFMGRTSKGKNFKLWESMKEGSVFWNIDLKSAYWQMCYRLGYIDDKLFFKYLQQEEYKHAKRYCISFLARSNKMVYNYPSEGRSHEISCDNGVLIQVYKNIRNELYNSIAYAMGDLDVDNGWLEYNIDGVTVVGTENVKLVKERFISLGLDFKSTLCIKEDDVYYKSGSSRKAFKKVLR